VDECKGKRVLVTGGMKGMGEAMVRRFTFGGASVATTARSPLHADQKPALFVQAGLPKSFGSEPAAAVRLDRAFVPGMIERQLGVVIHISSIQPRLSLHDSTLACAEAKGA